MADESVKTKLPVLDDDDDFDIGALKTGTEEKKEVPEEEETDDKKKDDKEETKKVDTKDEKKEGEEEKKPVKVEDEDLFSEEDKTEKKPRSLKEVAKKLDIDLDKDDDDEEFEKKVTEKISKSRQEFNLDGYSDDAKALIKHLNENGGDVESFFTNKNIVGLQSVLSLNAEEKVRQVRYNELLSESKTKEDASTALDEEIKQMSTREMKDLADDIDQQAKKLIQAEVKKIVGDRELKTIAERQKKETETVTERTNLKSFVSKQDTFLGMKLSSKAKDSILRDIDNGVFDKVLKDSPEMQKFSAYMLSKHGSKILKKIETSLSESNREGYNNALKKSTDALHKVDDESIEKKTGHEAVKKTSTGNKPKWSDEDIE